MACARNLPLLPFGAPPRADKDAELGVALLSTEPAKTARQGKKHSKNQTTNAARPPRGGALAYQCYFALVWLPSILAIPTALTLAIWSLTQYQSAPRLWIGLAIAAVLTIAALLMRTHASRTMIRAGAWPALCTGDYYPRTEEELRQAVRAIVKRTGGKPPTIVGSGWGFFLSRRGAVGPRNFTHRYTGLQEHDTQRWKSGTTIMALTRTLLKQNRVLQTYPTMDHITLGSWFAMGNHGNGGPEAGKSSDAMVDARVLDMTTDRIERIKYKRLRELFDGSDAYKYCVLDVRIGNTIENELVQKKGLIIDSEEAAADWLRPRSHLRLIFMGAARRDYGIGLLWLPIYDRKSDHYDPHLCSRFCQFVQVDAFSAACGCHEPMANFNGKISRFHANQWMPPTFPLQVLFVMFAGYRNFEILFKLPGTKLNGANLWALMRAFMAMHQRIGGRSELRNGNEEGIICMDMSLTRGFREPFELLHERFQVRWVSLHLGKWHDLSTHPCKKVSLSELSAM